ncbi:MAG: hypothetical protein LBQ66_01525 [Planctomycetaceae bacterium]|nr:hypothetical protein [Planctomycetaceae bacterium]
MRRRNRPAVGYPPYIYQHVLAFSSNLFGSITHRGGRDARVPVLCRLSAAFANIKTFHAPLGDEGKPRPYNVNVFWFWVIEIPVRVGDPVVGLRRRNRPAVGYPPYVYRHVLVFSSNLFGSITHRGGRDARVPVRRHFAAIVCLSADGGRIGEPMRFPLTLSACADVIHQESPAVGYTPYDHQRINRQISSVASYRR